MHMGLMQPYFFPYIGYWQLINAVDKYVIYDDVSFIKGGWINRNKILINGDGRLLNLQMHNASPNKLIKEVDLLKNPISSSKLLQTLEMAYKKAPCYTGVFAMLENIIMQDQVNLALYLEYSIRSICSYLSIDTQIVVSSSVEKNNDLRGQNKVLEICKVLGADTYVNSIGGQKLYSSEDFAACGIQLKFLKSGLVEYKQFDNDYIPNLSIIDVLMFNSKDSVRELLGVYKLI